MKIHPNELKQLIKEEAIRMKKRMMLESEKASILKRLQKLEECDMMQEEMPGDAAAEPEVALKPEVEAAIQRNAKAILSKISPEQAAKAAAELQAAGLAGASINQIEDKVEEILPLNEAMMNEAWDKSKIYNWLVGGGLGATLAGLVTTALGSIPTQELSNLADYTNATVTPTSAVIAGLVVTALGAIAVSLGMKGHNKLAADKNQMSADQAARIIAARKAKHGR